MATETKDVTCGFCQGGCQVTITLEDGVLAAVKPNSQSPRARLCPRGALVPKFIYGEQRVKTPLIRNGARGMGELREATWDEALDHAATLIKDVTRRHGARAMASYFGRGVLFSPVMGMSSGPEAFLRNIGSPNDCNCGSICNLVSSTIAPALTLGVPTMKQVQDVPNSDLIVSWGKNSATDDGPQIMLAQIQQAQARGAKLIVIDPRLEGLGQIADWWIPILPGTDGALALAMCKIIVEENRYDTEFVRDWTQGFEEFAVYLATLELEKLGTICGVPVADIRKLTDEFCGTQKASLVSYTGLEYALSAVQNIRAQYVLWAITGKLDVEGGIYLNAWGQPTQPVRPVPEENTPLGAAKYPLYFGLAGMALFGQFPHAVLDDDPHPVRGLLVVGGSPAVSFPDSNTWRAAYERLECLIVVDRFYSEEVRYADVVLPAKTLYEMIRVQATPEGPALIDPALETIGQARDESIILGQLADRLGFGDKYPRNEDELRSWLVAAQRPFVAPFKAATPPARAYKKYATGQLRADGKPGFPTPSGKFEIRSTTLEQFGYTPYPRFEDVRDLPGFGADEWPLLMTTGARSNKRMGGLGANLAPIGEGIDPKPLVDINEADAATAGIADGDAIVVETPFGQAPFYAHVGGATEGAIHVPHGGGSAYMPQPWREGNANCLTSLEFCDSITGFPMLKSVPCRIRKA